MAGGGQLPGSIAVDQKNAEIYSPPYLFKGAAADDLGCARDGAYGVELRRHDAGRRADRERLADPLAVGDARVRPEPALPVPQLHGGAGKVTVQAPANANLAPPGDYMLFLVDTNGVPSVGDVRARRGPGRHDAADRADATSRRRRRPARSRLPGRLRPTPGGHRGYNVHRSTTPGFTPSTANRIGAADRSDASRTPAVATGTYYYKVTAEDDGRQRRRRLERGDRRRSDRAARRGLVGGVGLRRGQRDDDRRPVRRTATTERSRARPGDRRASSAARSRSTARTRSVTVPDSTSLDLTTGMTIEAWVKPTGGGGWRTLLVKERRATSSTASTRTPTRTGRSRR